MPRRRSALPARRPDRSPGRPGLAPGADRHRRRPLRPRPRRRPARLPPAPPRPPLPLARDHLRVAHRAAAHLAGLRIAALDGARRSRPIVVASAIALAEAVPDNSLWPEGFALRKGRVVDLGDVADLLADAGYERVDQVEERGSVRDPRRHPRRLSGDRGAGGAGGAVRRRDRIAPLVLDLHPALARRRRAGRARAGGGARRRAPRAAASRTRPRSSSCYRLPPRPGAGDGAGAIAPAEEIPGALRDHWEDVTTAMHADDARRLYVDLAEPLEARAGSALSAADAGQELSFRAQSAELPSRTLGGGRGRAREAGPLRLPHRRRLRASRRGRARPLQPRAASTSPSSRTSPRRSRGELRRGEAARGLPLARAEAGRDPLPPPRPSAPGGDPGPARARLAAAIELRVGDLVVHEDHGVARFSGFDTKTLGGVTRDYLELEYRGGDGSSPRPTSSPRSAATSAPMGRARSSAPRGQRWQNLKARARRAARSGRRAAQPLRRAPGRRRPRVLRPTASGSSASRPPSPTGRPPTRSRRSTRSRATWRPSGRWTG